VTLCLGIAGAGTMGAGIAAAARDAGLRVLLHDPDPEAEGRVDGVEWAADPAGLAPCDVVIEAAPEVLELKRALFGALADIVAPDTVLATNTSSLLVTEIAAGVPHPERVVGLHFFNPVPKMRLAELVAGEASSEAALARARAVGEAMGKHVIAASDGPGFIVNRCNRPFSLEALRIVQERLATPEQVDRICRRAAGFRMGPFELMDLVGIDVGYAISRSFYEQSYGEPRWRPSPLAARMAASGRLGRKSGRGWYAYPPGRPADPKPPTGIHPPDDTPLIVVAGDSELADWLLAAADEAGWDAAPPADAEGEVPFLILDCGATEEDPPLQGGPQLLLCDAVPLSAQDPGGSAAGFYLPTPVLDGGVVELTRSVTTAPAAVTAAEHFFATLGRTAEWVGDAPGLVSGRMLATLVNEACFALGEDVGSAADIDSGMELGLNHPRGPLAWGDLIGPGTVLNTLLALGEEYREERYRPAPALVRAARADAELHEDG
jgi:3-hydroxybutyryl-CoA dehydrogenase